MEGNWNPRLSGYSHVLGLLSVVWQVCYFVEPEHNNSACLVRRMARRRTGLWRTSGHEAPVHHFLLSSILLHVILLLNTPL